MIRAGFAQRVITPPTGVPLAGYFHDRVGKTVRDDLHAKAMVLESNGNQVCLVACDLISMTGEITRTARAAVSERLGIPPEAVLICATHTHTGPQVREGRIVPVDPDWIKTLAPALVEVVEAAAGQMFEAQLRPGFGCEDELSFNRLLRMRDGVERFGWSGDPTQVAGVAGPIDPEMVVLGVYDAEHKLRGLLVNFALHVDVIGGSSADFISADWPGELARTVASVHGEDVVTLFLQGTCGDINHCTHYPTELPTGGPAKALQLGRALGATAINAVEKAEPSHDETFSAMLQELEIPYYTVDEALRQEAAALRETNPEDDFERFLMHVVETWPHNGEIARVPLQVLRLGSLAIVGLPAEVFVHWGLLIKEWSPAAYTMVVELANDWFGYVPTTDQAERGGYGAKPILSRQLISGAGRIMADAAFMMLNKLWSSSEAPTTDVSVHLEAAMKPYRS